VHYHASTGRGALPFQPPRQKFRRTVRGKKILAPPVGSLPLLRWARGPLSVPCTLGTPAHHLQVESRGRVYIHELSHVLRLRILPPCKGGLWCYYTSRGSESHLLARESSSTAICPAALELASLLRRASMLACIQRHSMGCE
jgi:hypothetical protein